MRNFPVIAVILILIPAIEIFTFVQVGQGIGYFTALLLLIVMTLFGSFMLRRQGVSTIRHLSQAVASGRLPAMEMLESMLVGLSALFLLIPGFVSDVIGLLLLIPYTRRGLIKLWFKGRYPDLNDLLRSKTQTTAQATPTPQVILEPEQLIAKPQDTPKYDYEGEYVRKE